MDDHEEPHRPNYLQIIDANSTYSIAVTCPTALIGIVLNLMSFWVWVKDRNPFTFTVSLFRILSLSQFLSLLLLMAFRITTPNRWMSLWVEKTRFSAFNVFYQAFFQMTINVVLLLALCRVLVVRFPAYCEVMIKCRHIAFTVIILSVISLMEILLVEILSLRNPDYTLQIHVSFIASERLLPCVLVIPCMGYVLWKTFRLKANVEWHSFSSLWRSSQNVTAVRQKCSICWCRISSHLVREQAQRMEGVHNTADLTCCTLTITFVYILFWAVPMTAWIPTVLCFQERHAGLQSKAESLVVVEFFWTFACSFSSLAFFSLPRFRALLLQPWNRCHQRLAWRWPGVLKVDVQGPVGEGAFVRGERSEELGTFQTASDDPQPQSVEED